MFLELLCFGAAFWIQWIYCSTKKSELNHLIISGCWIGQNVFQASISCKSKDIGGWTHFETRTGVSQMGCFNAPFEPKNMKDFDVTIPETTPSIPIPKLHHESKQNPFGHRGSLAIQVQDNGKDKVQEFPQLGMYIDSRHLCVKSGINHNCIKIAKISLWFSLFLFPDKLPSSTVLNHQPTPYLRWKWSLQHGHGFLRHLVGR